MTAVTQARAARLAAHIAPGVWRHIRRGLWMRVDGASVSRNPDGRGWFAHDGAGQTVHNDDADWPGEPGEGHLFPTAKEGMGWLDVFGQPDATEGCV